MIARLVRMAMLMAALAIAGPAVAADAKPAPVLSDDGLHVEPFFLLSLLDLRDDLREAQESGRRFAVVFEQRGCPYCRDMHEINFAMPAIADYVRDNFVMVQLNLYGSREVTDFDGQVLAEKDLARKWGIVFTPTILYFPETVADNNKRAGRDLAVMQMPGYFRPFHFYAMFRYVREKRTADTPFQKYLVEQADEIQKVLGVGLQ